MARWREEAIPGLDADRAAALEEADTIARLAVYELKAADPPIPGLWDRDRGGWQFALNDESEARELCEQQPEHPAVISYLSTLEVVEEMRKEALADG